MPTEVGNEQSTVSNVRHEDYKSPTPSAGVKEESGETSSFCVLSGKKAEHFKQLLETRIAEFNRVLVAAEQETRASAARHADPADQAAAEYERQSIGHKSNTARQMRKTLTQAVERIQHGSFGEGAEWGGEIEPKRSEERHVGRDGEVGGW